ncbi:uroporphyrinogen-III synthase [Sessilibacter sp. MAH1]
MTVWLTRPEKQAQKTLQLLHKAGFEVWVCPVMEIVPIADPSARQHVRDQVMNLDLYHKAIFVSQNAVDYAAEEIEQFWPQLPLNTEFYAVGRATAKAAHKYNIEIACDVGETMDSESLLAIAAMHNVQGQKVLIFRGIGGRTTLAEVLTERGARVDYCELYERSQPRQSLHALIDQGFGRNRDDIILAYSGESLENVHRAIKHCGLTSLVHQPVIVPGKRVAELAKQLGFSQVFIAENATDEIMLKTLYHAYAMVSG